MNIQTQADAEVIAHFVEHLRDEYLSQLMSVKAVARRIREQFEITIPADAEQVEEAALVCATHDVPREVHIVCPQCMGENPELDACARELEDSNREIKRLRSHLRSFEE